MKTSNEIKVTSTPTPSFGQACVSSCQKLVAQIKQAKNTILAEFKDTFQAQEHLLRLALNEAEALAWQTDFPQLVFADLALEKAQAAAAWQQRQRQLR